MLDGMGKESDEEGPDVYGTRARSESPYATRFGRRAGPVPLPAAEVSVPVFRPKRRTRVPALVGSLVLLAAGGIVGYATHRPGSSSSPPVGGFSVTGITVDANPASLACPATATEFTASVSVSGGSGRLQYRWLLPNGSTTASQSLDVPAGQRAVSISESWTVSRQASFSGTAELSVTAPDVVYSAPTPFRYSCAA